MTNSTFVWTIWDVLDGIILGAAFVGYLALSIYANRMNRKKIKK